ncbi:ribosomal subunit interface protein [Mycobacterium kansasii]|uniref:Ribosomal subunit interface protein n=1 Tax=Mycobacterium kansasii TaxID=1768 RepID=A0A1V3W980_MYCKA|nr:ribosomal subunit interface protein [Mycobacterium kansasii]
MFKGRNVEIPDHFRIYVSQKLARLERFDRTIYLFDVELDHERNRRQRKSCQRVEVTARGRDPLSAARLRRQLLRGLESAVANWRPAAPQQRPPQSSLRQDAVSLAEATAAARHRKGLRRGAGEPHEHDGANWTTNRTYRPRQGTPGKPMSVDDALYEMELVGHDFFLFFDKETERPPSSTAGTPTTMA